MRSAAAYKRAGTLVIIGVARDSVCDAFGEPAQPAVYFSYRDLPASQGEIHLRARNGNETALASEAQAVLRDLDPMLPLYDVRTFSQHIERNLYLRRIPARMFVVLGPLLLGSRRSESTPWFRTPWPGERERLACGWRSGPPAGRSSCKLFAKTWV
jgi:hypothetical protein